MAANTAAMAQAQAQQAKAKLILNPRVQFADWLKRTYPQIFVEALDTAEKQKALMQAKAAGVLTEQLGEWNLFSEPAASVATVDKSFWQKFLDGALAAGTSYLSLKNQKDILELNIERAKLGQPPLDAATTAPVVRTQVDIDPALARDLASNVGAGISRNMLILGGAALALFFFMRK